MFWNFMLNQTRPWLLGFEFYLGMCIPIVIYLQNTTGIFIIITLMILLMLLPKPMVLSYDNFAYHMIRGIFLELTGEINHYSMFSQLLLGGFKRKIIAAALYLSILIYSLYMLWDQYLLLGSLLFYGLTAFEMYIAAEYANISKNTLTNEKWEILIADDTL